MQGVVQYVVFAKANWAKAAETLRPLFAWRSDALTDFKVKDGRKAAAEGGALRASLSLKSVSADLLSSNQWATRRKHTIRTKRKS